MLQQQRNMLGGQILIPRLLERCYNSVDILQMPTQEIKLKKEVYMCHNIYIIEINAYINNQLLEGG